MVTVHQIGRIERIPLRDVWRHEAHSFTVWLADNIELLGEEIGLELHNAEREQAAGSFSADIVAEDAGGAPVIIENQYGRSDHDHLGKLLTYMTSFEAKTAIWLVEEARPEHLRAVAWLNEASSGSFYLIKMEAIRIGESTPAPLFTVIVGPTEEAREVGERKRELAERHHVRHEFWTRLLEQAKQQTKLHANISPGMNSWSSAGAGMSGLSFNYVILQDYSRVDLSIDRGNAKENRRLLNLLKTKQDEIESAFGDALEWTESEGVRACRIVKSIDAGGLKDREKWDEIIRVTIDAMVRLEKALGSHLQALRNR